MSNTKKSLLNENTVRRFMKLAEIDKLSDGFVDGLVKEGDMAYNRDEEPFEQPAEDGAVDGLSGAGPDDEDLDLDLDMDDDAEGPEEAPGEHVALADAIENLMDVISTMTGAEIKVGPDTEAADDDLLTGAEELEDDNLEEQSAATTSAGERAARALPTQPARPGRGGMGTTRVQPAQSERHSGTEADRPRVATVPESYNREAAYHQAAYHQAIHEEGLQREAEYRHALKQEVLRRVTGRLHQENHKDAVADQLSERILRRIKNQSKK